jgi:hypothetical protein
MQLLRDGWFVTVVPIARQRWQLFLTVSAVSGKDIFITARDRLSA